MLLALDIGNSAVKGGFFEGDELVDVFSVSPETVDLSGRAAAAAWRDALTSHLSSASIEHVGVASVVPTTADAIMRSLAARREVPVTQIRTTMPLPFDLGYETPDTLGADRLAAAAGGWMEFGRSASPSRSVVVVDAGTAVTCEVVHRDGVYQGGTIGAGPVLTRHALREGTAQLPAVPLSLPDDPVGDSTQRALQSGVMWNLVDSVRGMTDRLAATLPDAPRIVLTGGWSSLLIDHLDCVDHCVPHLVLRGVRHLLESNGPQRPF